MKARIQWFVMVALVAVVFFSVHAAYALQETPPDGITESQFFIIGLVSSALLWILRLIVSKGYEPSREIVAIGLYVISFVLAIWFTPIAFPQFPPFTDAPRLVAGFLSWLGSLIDVASPIVGVAYLIYNIILKRVLEGAQSRIAKLTGNA